MASSDEDDAAQAMRRPPAPPAQPLPDEDTAMPDMPVTDPGDNLAPAAPPKSDTPTKTKASKHAPDRRGLASRPIVAKTKKPAEPLDVASSAPHKITRRRKAGYETHRKGDEKSFAKIENPEATVAAYCGFSDIGRFRSFYTSDWVLPYYIKYLRYKRHNRTRTMSLLKDAPYEEYWETDDDPLLVYPPDETFTTSAEQNHCLSYGAGLVAWQLLRQLRKGVLENEDTVSNRAEFTTVTGCQLPTNMSSFPKGNLPNSGPLAAFQELDLEPLNRCLSVFAHMKYATAPSQWKPRFLGKTAWNLNSTITLDFVPSWTIPSGNVTVAEAPDQSTAPADAIQSRTVCRLEDQIT